MPQLSARRVALAALQAWRARKQFADTIISELTARANPSAEDRRFALELFYGVLRNLTLLDFWIRSLRSSRIDVDLTNILRLGLYQLLMLSTAEHAAVYETVELAPKRRRSLINGILRSALRRKEQLLDKAKYQPLEIRTSHPAFLIERWQKHFGAQAAEALCVWDNQSPTIYARVNQLRIDQTKFQTTYPESRAVPNASNFFEFDSVPIVALRLGHCYVQDPSTAIACELLDAKPGESILDACAAPGGKTGHLAGRMENRGLIVACDRQPKRLTVLTENLERLGVSVATSVRCDWTLDEIQSAVVNSAPFDRILVDAPCSNTGVIRRRLDVRWRLGRSDFDRMQKRQIAIVRRVLPFLKTKGVLVYSTCSLEPEENENVIASLLTEMSILRLETYKICLPFRDHFDGAFAARLIKTNE